MLSVQTARLIDGMHSRHCSHDNTFSPCRPCSRFIFQRARVVYGQKYAICSAASAISEDGEQPAACSSPFSRRSILQAACLTASPVACAGPAAAARDAAAFVTSESGLKIEDIREGSGAAPSSGSRVAVHWSGYTIGYQGKRIENTSARDTPFEFVLGKGQVIPAFEEAVAGMRAGGVRRVEIPGTLPELGWARNRSLRYNVGPKPADFDGQRALDFVLDNGTLQDFNRTLLIDIKLLSVRN